MLYQLAYISRSRSPLDQTTLSDILDVSQRNNARDEITGVLKFHDDLFFQILEGERAAVEDCYHKRISYDSRHKGLSLTWCGFAESRTFSDWSMVYAGPDEIGLFTHETFRSLDHLKNDKGLSSTRRNEPTALVLAQTIFGDLQIQR